MKNGKVTGESGLVSKMEKSAGVAGIGMMADLTNQIIVGVIPATWALSTIVNSYKGKRDALTSAINRSDSEDSSESYPEVIKPLG